MAPLLPFQISSAGKLLCVVDLDLTLVHSIQLEASSPASPDCHCIISNAELRAMGYPLAQDQRNVWARPGFRDFLKRVSQFADIVVWTLSQIDLARLTLTKLDVDRCIKGVVGRDDTCFRGYALHNNASVGTQYTPSDELPRQVITALKHMNSAVNAPHFLKDLSALGYDLSRTVIVDDWPDLALFNPTNLLTVDPFDKSNLNDSSLLNKILPALVTLAHPDVDVRKVLSGNGVHDELLTRCFAKHRNAYSHILHHHRMLCASKRTWTSLTELQKLEDHEVKEPCVDLEFKEPAHTEIVVTERSNSADEQQDEEMPEFPPLTRQCSRNNLSDNINPIPPLRTLSNSSSRFEIVLDTTEHQTAEFGDYDDEDEAEDMEDDDDDSLELKRAEPVHVSNSNGNSSYAFSDWDLPAFSAESRDD